MKKTDFNFITNYEKFVAAPDDIQSLEACVRIMKQKMNLTKMSNPLSKTDSGDDGITDCIYIYAASHNAYKKVKSSIKV